jgi:hypothetical protein
VVQPDNMFRIKAASLTRDVQYLPWRCEARADPPEDDDQVPLRVSATNRERVTREEA